MGHQEAKSNLEYSGCCSQPLADAPPADSPSSSISFDKELAIDARNILQGLVCLSSLIHANAADLGKLLVWKHNAEWRYLSGKQNVVDAVETAFRSERFLVF